MRTLKFRFWKDGVLQGYKELTPKDKIIDMAYEWTHVDQFTGLSDRHSKEIYEGDIVAECLVGQVIWNGDGVIQERPCGKVYWAHHGWNIHTDKVGVVKEKVGSKMHKMYGEFGPAYMSCYDGQFEWPDNIEVIGNIYENPELLIQEAEEAMTSGN